MEGWTGLAASARGQAAVDGAYVRVESWRSMPTPALPAHRLTHACQTKPRAHTQVVSMRRRTTIPAGRPTHHRPRCDTLGTKSVRSTIRTTAHKLPFPNPTQPSPANDEQPPTNDERPTRRRRPQRTTAQRRGQRQRRQRRDQPNERGGGDYHDRRRQQRPTAAASAASAAASAASAAASASSASAAAASAGAASRQRRRSDDDNDDAPRWATGWVELSRPFAGTVCRKRCH